MHKNLSRLKWPLILAAISFTLACSVMPSGHQAKPSGKDLESARIYYKGGDFKHASAILKTYAGQNDPEAVLYMFIIKNNALDGEADPKGQAGRYLNQLAGLRPTLETIVNDRSFSVETKLSARTALAYLYYYGAGVPRDINKAADWASSSAVGFGPARNMQANIALMREREGRAFFQFGGARQAFLISYENARFGDRLAMANLSFLYRNGLGVDRDDFEAARWARESAGAKAPKAFNELGMFYETGRGVSQDFNEAKRWYGLGAAAHYKLSHDNLARFKKAEKNHLVPPPSGLPLTEEDIAF